MNPVKVLALADVHQSAEKWSQLVSAVKNLKPDLVLIAGDIYPKDEGILNQVNYSNRLRNHAEAIRNVGAEIVLIPGNDDNRLIVPELVKGDAEGLWHCVADRVKEIKGFEFCGCPWIRDYPFGYKHWVAPESPEDLSISPFQIGPPLTIDDKNEVEAIINFEAYLKKKRSIIESLDHTAGMVKNMKNSIWLIHEPPAGLDLDLCASGDRVGSPLVYKFLEEKQPLFSIHGHIHEAPKYNGGIWAAKIGRTFCVQPGQLDEVLYYVTFKLNTGRVERLSHSVYGKY